MADQVVNRKLPDDEELEALFEKLDRETARKIDNQHMIESLKKGENTDRPLTVEVEEKWGVIRPVEGWCKDCVYNLGDPLKANCEMFVADYNGDKPPIIHYEGKECPLYLKLESASNE